MTETNHAAIGADARPATFDAWANEYCYGLLTDGDDGARVARLAARAAWDAAIASAAQPNNDWAQSAAELIAMRGYLADSADTPRVAHLLAQIVPATQRLPTAQEAPQHAAQGDALDAARWRYAVAIGGNQVMNWLDVYDDWNGEGYFADAIDAARAKEGASND